MAASGVILRHASVVPWPAREQELLLRAALLQGPAALAAWNTWKSEVDFDRIDSESYRVLPQLYFNLTAHGVSDALVGRLKGIYRRTWYQNQLRFHAMSRPLRLLHEAGIPTMLLKGAALIRCYYQDYGLRPMSDFDICVPGDRVSRTLEVLEGQGFVPQVPEFSPERHFTDRAGLELDVHWQVFPESLAPDASEACWLGSVETELHGTSTRVLNAADQLLHVCVHGIVHAPIWGETSRVRWVMDALATLRDRTTQLDWDRLLAMSRRCRFMPPLRDGLTYLRRTFDAPIPESVLERLHTARVPVVDRMVHRVRSQPWERCPPWLSLCVAYIDHSRSLPIGTGVIRTLAGFPGYCRHRWAAKQFWHLPLIAAFKAIRRIGLMMRSWQR